MARRDFSWASDASRSSRKNVTLGAEVCYGHSMEAPPHVDKWDREAIEAALHNPHPGNALAIAIADAIRSFGEKIVERAAQTGRFPTRLQLPKPSSPFDEAVVGLTLSQLADLLGQRIEVDWFST